MHPSFIARSRLPLLFLLAVSAAVPAQESQFFSVLQQPDAYPQPRRTLQHLVQTEAKQRINHLCVIGYQTSPTDPGKYAWVYWKEGHALILWEAWKGPDPASALTPSRRHLNLDKDVVASEAELQGSTYLVTKAWVQKTESDCGQHGDKFLIAKKGSK